MLPDLLLSPRKKASKIHKLAEGPWGVPAASGPEARAFPRFRAKKKLGYTTEMDCAGFRFSQFAPPLVESSLRRDGTVQAAKFPQSVRTTIHVDSRDRNFDAHPSSSEFVVDLPECIRNVSSAVLVTAELPLMYYVFSMGRGNTSLTVAVDDVSHTVTIPDGNYSATTMAAALKSALDTAFSKAFTVTIDPVSQKCTIAVTGVVAVDGRGATKATEWGLGWYLGFRGGVLTSGTNSVTGTRVANLNPENYVLLDIQELNNISQGAMYDAGGSGRKIFAKIPLTGNNYSYNFYDKAVSYVEQRPQLTKVDRLHVALRFHDGSLVDLNGSEWSFSVEFSGTLTRAL